MKQKRYVALLRGINVGGHKKIPMAELRKLAMDAGWRDVRSHIQSGNLVFTASGANLALETALEVAIDDQFGLQVPVIVRPEVDWATYTRTNPFGKASATEPNRVMLCLSKQRPRKPAIAELRERAAEGESMEQVGDALWFHFPAGVGKTKLTTAVLDRVVGSKVTLRNCRTVLRLDEMLNHVRE